MMKTRDVSALGRSHTIRAMSQPEKIARIRCVPKLPAMASAAMLWKEARSSGAKMPVLPTTAANASARNIPF